MLQAIPAANAAIQDEHDYIVQTYSRPDFVLVRGQGMTLYDANDTPYQDWVAGIAVNALGYGDAGIGQVIQRQLETGLIHTSNLFYTVPQTQLAKLLVEKSFADRVFFSNTGTEANEGAIKFARRLAYNSGIADKYELVAFSHAFHGRTMGALTMTPKEKYQQPFKPLLPGVSIGEFNDIESAKSLINEKTAAVIVEPIQGEGGINIATDEFLQVLRDLCDKYNAVLIYDEVQCGMGRTGKLWAHEHSGVTPDMMTIAKPLAAGLPIGAILVTQRVADALKPGDHGTTFGGGPVVTSVASYVVEKISQPDFLESIAETGDYLMERLQEVNSPLIKEVRGKGLMVGVEMTIDVSNIIKAGYDEGLLLVNAGAEVIRLVPPLIATKDDVDTLVERLTKILESIDA